MYSTAPPLDYFQVDALSNSGMSGLNPEQGGSPKRFKHTDRTDEKYNLSLDRGSLLHLAILEPDKFVVQDVDKPSGLMGQFVEAYFHCRQVYEAAFPVAIIPPVDHDELVRIACEKAGYKIKPETVWKNYAASGEFQAYYDYLKRAGTDKLSVTQETRSILDSCVANLKAHPVAHNLLFDDDVDILTWNELEVYFSVDVVTHINGFEEVVTVPCKIKVDRLRYHLLSRRAQNVDLKTTGGGLGKFPHSYEQFRYYRQNAFYDLGIRHFLSEQGLDVKSISHLNVVVETTGLNEVGVYKSSDEWLKKGQLEYEKVLELYAWHRANNLWEYPKEYYLNGGLLVIPPPKQST